MITRFSFASWLATFLVPFVAPANPPTVKELSSYGPFPVGVTTTVLVDHSRKDPVTDEPRMLVTEIWYPATEDARSLPKAKYTDFLPGGITPELERLIRQTYKQSSEDLNKRYWTHCARDARVREGKFPVVLFSHGNGGNRHQNTFWCDFLASHGYVIVSPDHTANAPMTVLYGKVIPYTASLRNLSAADRPKDMSFLLDQMILWNKGGDSRFTGKLGLNAVCASGMSFGALTSVALIDQDSRIKSVIAMSGSSIQHTNRNIPTLWMLGEEDTTIGAAGNALIRAHHGMNVAASYLFEMKNGGHYSFTDMFKIIPGFGDGVGSGTRRSTKEKFEFTGMEKTYQMINAYSLAFLEYYVRGKKEHLEFLKKNHFPEELEWKVRNLPAAAP